LKIKKIKRVLIILQKINNSTTIKARLAKIKSANISIPAEQLYLSFLCLFSLTKAFKLRLKVKNQNAI